MLGAHSSSSSCFTINILEKMWAKLNSGSLVTPILLGRWKTIGWDSRSVQRQRQTSLFAPSSQSYNLVIYANFTKNKYLSVSFSLVSWFLPLQFCFQLENGTLVKPLWEKPQLNGERNKNQGTRDACKPAHHLSLVLHSITRYATGKKGGKLMACSMPALGLFCGPHARSP